MKEGAPDRQEKPGMTRESRRLAGVLLVVLPSVMYGGQTLLTMLIQR